MEGFEQAILLTALKESTKKDFEQWFNISIGEDRNQEAVYPNTQMIFDFFWEKIQIQEETCIDLSEELTRSIELCDSMKEDFASMTSNKIAFKFWEETRNEIARLKEETNNHFKHLQLKHTAVRELLESLQLAMKYADSDKQMPDGLQIGINRIINHYSSPQNISNEA